MTDRAEQVEAVGGEAGAEIPDPFARDFFAPTSHASAGEADGAHASLEDINSPAPERPWHSSLPGVSAEDVRRSAALAALVPSLSSWALEALTRVLARLARIRTEEVGLEIMETRQAALSEFAGPPDGSQAPRLFLIVSVEPDGAPVAVALGADFVTALVDHLLGGEGAPPSALRAPSTTERAVIEFLCLSALHELNALAGEPLFRLEAVTDSFSQRPAARFGTGARLLVTTARVAAVKTVGLVRLALGEDGLTALSHSGNRLLARVRDGA
ncbi:MAG: hypothetical protein ACRD68_18845, partial [Pyrinomonadaceae bacterium]